MIDEICAEIKNYFTYDSDRHFGVFKIENGQIVPSVDIPTQYFRIVGSRLNDGVHKVGAQNDLVDEGEFDGAIWIMSPPKAFLDLVEEIKAWQNKYGGADSSAMSPYSSESFGGYSYSKNTGNTEGGKGGIGWKKAYADRLNRWRKIRVM